MENELFAGEPLFIRVTLFVGFLLLVVSWIGLACSITADRMRQEHIRQSAGCMERIARFNAKVLRLERSRESQDRRLKILRARINRLMKKKPGRRT